MAGISSREYEAIMEEEALIEEDLKEPLISQEQVETLKKQLNNTEVKLQDMREIAKEVPMFDNLEKGNLTEKQLQMITELMRENIKLQREQIDALNKTVNDLSNKIQSYEEDKTLKRKKKIEINFSPVKKAVERIKELVSNLHDKYQGVKDAWEQGNKTRTDAKKIAESIKTIDAQYRADITNSDIVVENKLSEIRDLQAVSLKASNRAMIEYEKGVKQRERAYAVTVLKEGVKSFAKTGKLVVPSRSKFGMKPEPEAQVLIDNEIKIAAKTNDRIKELEKEIAEETRNTFLRSAKFPMIDRPEEMDLDSFNKASRKMRDALAKNASPEFEQYITAVSHDNELDIDVMTYDTDQLRQIKMGMDNGLDVSLYAQPEISAQKMAVIRTMQEWGIDAEMVIKKELSQVKGLTLENMNQERLLGAAVKELDAELEKSAINFRSLGEINGRESMESLNAVYKGIKNDLVIAMDDKEMNQVKDSIEKDMKEHKQRRSTRNREKGEKEI